MSFDGFTGAILVLLAMFFLMLGFAFSETATLDDCVSMGKTRIQGKVYICYPEQRKENHATAEN